MRFASFAAKIFNGKSIATLDDAIISGVPALGLPKIKSFEAKNVKIVALLDHSGEAEKAGLKMMPTIVSSTE